MNSTWKSVKSVFPNQLSFVLFVLYIAMFTANGLLVALSRQGTNSYSFNTVTVVLFIEILKFVMATLGYLTSHGISNLEKDIREHKRLIHLYFIPAFLYCIYNNLTYPILTYFDPTTYYTLSQLNYIPVGITYQIFFKRKLSRIQWFSLGLLTIGCMLKGVDMGGRETGHNGGVTGHIGGASVHSGSVTTHSGGVAGHIGGYANTEVKAFSWLGFSLIIIQFCSSVVAGVYTEYLMKVEGPTVDVMLLNTFLYFDSIICNIILLSYKADLVNAFTTEALSSIFQPQVLLIIVNMSCLGLVTSLVLKKLDSLIKAFGTAIEIILLAILSYPVLGVPLHLGTIFAIIIVVTAIILYTKNPYVDDSSNSPSNVLQNYDVQ